MLAKSIVTTALLSLSTVASVLASSSSVQTKTIFVTPDDKTFVTSAAAGSIETQTRYITSNAAKAVTSYDVNSIETLTMTPNPQESVTSIAILSPSSPADNSDQTESIFVTPNAPASSVLSSDTNLVEIYTVFVTTAQESVTSVISDVNVAETHTVSSLLMLQTPLLQSPLLPILLLMLIPSKRILSLSHLVTQNSL
ncbi:unnamed protein product [Ambrosiozyma monospora]|uniref:Unnamed protein product n=1 Tax=Ambrosiozyma monospora TaxID=43982 RepID=A0ACB5U520_AMBMO|nr:unnamed protein product [Ambrosiozyma monospora]